ncbi:MAG: histidine kinase [Bacteroidales bacterium]|nr:histidine kinase [Bacteroidales bacterium]
MFDFLFLLLTAVVVFFVVMGITNLWVRYRIWHDDALVMGRIYTSKRMLWLYLKSWSILMSGLLLSYLFDWLMLYLPETLYNLTIEFRILFYVLCGLLCLFSLISVVNGELLVELRLRTAENENQLLRSQLNPHFLYNTLNNIDALIWLDQERASSAITSLSSLMRYFTYSGRLDAVNIGDEVAHLTELVELQRLRMLHPESLIFEVSIDDNRQQVAPLLLLPLVENCFKHCGSLSEERAIVIQISLKEGLLTYSSDNNLKSQVEVEAEANHGKSHGVGMQVLRRRLDLLYNGRFELDLHQQENRFLTSLKVNL